MYFEFDDARRFHQPYTDPFLKMPTWHPPAYQTYHHKFTNGWLAASIGLFATEPLYHYGMHTKLLNQFYEWPTTRQEYNIFFREVFRMPEFWPELFKKLSFGVVAAAGDVGLKLALWQHVYGGIWHPQDLPDYNSLKHGVVGFGAALPFCWTALPFINAKRAYYADKTWPVEMRRNYRSPL